ncbi:hypothetical protein QBC46DRAFT_344196 [Diplogelasinospora grovesii]|uniref:Uncharacterized protein n=1 Tax=Diplogelasinospora grovesii TaxID=303347 RepID=A0AAN6N2G7_9PEZI|nr:hypothetical protein QBC46DRAFT_344196 [Diplogelasinospora grovesii]
MVNTFKKGDKGLAASRWATPAPVTPAPTTPITNTASSPPAPAKPLLEERGQGVKMVNFFKPGDKGLSASRWATPAPVTPAPTTTSPAPVKTFLEDLERATLPLVLLVAGWFLARMAMGVERLWMVSRMFLSGSRWAMMTIWFS